METEVELFSLLMQSVTHHFKQVRKTEERNQKSSSFDASPPRKASKVATLFRTLCRRASKHLTDSLNTPSCWCRQEQDDYKDISPALLIEQISMNVQPAETLITLNTTVKCVAHVNTPCYTGGHVEHLWVCSSNAQAGFVSIVPLHSIERVPIHTFKVAECNLVCAERVSKDNVAGKPRDSVWISTTDSEILVFTVEPLISDTRIYPRQILNPGSTVVCMLCIDRKVYCGVRGSIMVYTRDSDGGWSDSSQVQFGSGSVSSIISVGDTLWAACSDQIHVIQRGKLEDRIIHTTAGLVGQVSQMVKVGVGVFVSFHGKPVIVLFHSENRSVLQNFSILQAINESKCVGEDSSPGNYEVTSLTASVGFLWVGTNVGIILTYPLPRLRACVPKRTQRPHVALHGHHGVVRFLLPMKYDPVSGLAEQKSKVERPVSSMNEGSAVSKQVNDKEDRPIVTEVASTTLDEEAKREGNFQELQSLNTQGALDETQVKVCDTAVEVHPFVDSENSLDLASDEFGECKTGSTDRSDQNSLSDLSISGEKVNALYPTLMRNLEDQSDVNMTDGGQSTLDKREDLVDTAASEINVGTEVADRANSANVDQSRKARNWNTILVVSGGNGYMDRRERMDSPGDQKKDPCLLFWMYKI